MPAVAVANRSEWLRAGRKAVRNIENADGFSTSWIITVVKKNIHKQSWSARVVVRYAVLQLPALVLLVLVLNLIRQWVDIPDWLVWGMVALWVLKDMILFPFVWRAYDTACPGVVNCMVGARGVAKDRLDPSGYIQVQGELWLAEVAGGGPPIDKGQRVQVRESFGLKLLVQSDDTSKK